MGHIVESIEIAASSQQVWEYAQDYRQRTAWDVTVSRFEPVGGAAVGQGATVRIRTAGQPAMAYEAVYVSFDPYRVSAIKMTRPIRGVPFVRAAGSWRYREISEKLTRFTMSFDYEVKWDAAGALLDRLFLASAIRTGTARALRKLRAHFSQG
jgi:hypothetical protein